MRVRSLPLLSSVLALAFAMLVALPVATTAQSGLPATVSMYPAAAGPGDTVEVTGLDFPRNTTVVLELFSPSGKATLGTVATGGDGAFRELVSFPNTAPKGAWTLSARSADGKASTKYAFTSGDAAVVAPAVVPEVPVETAAAAAGNTTTDKLVLVLIAVVLGAVATAALYAWRLVNEDRLQPGMGAAEDLIWSGTEAEATPEMTATEEPHWKHEVTAEADDEPELAADAADAIDDEPEPARPEPAQAEEVPNPAQEAPAQAQEAAASA